MLSVWNTRTVLLERSFAMLQMYLQVEQALSDVRGDRKRRKVTT